MVSLFYFFFVLQMRARGESRIILQQQMTLVNVELSTNYYYNDLNTIKIQNI